MQQGKWLAALPVVLGVLVGLGSAQPPDEPLSPVITAANMLRLQSVAQIDFSPETYATGWFALSDDGQHLLTHTKTSQVHLMNAAGEILQTIQPAGDLRDAAFGSEQIAAVFADEDAIHVEMADIEGDAIQHVTIARRDYPAALWFTDTLLWLELLPSSPDARSTIYRVPAAPMTTEYEIPYAPAEDLDAVVRIGRIAPPYVVTSSAAGVVRVWQLETGDVIHEVENGLGIATPFGGMNAAATHLVWRDELNAMLYLLDFETGENRVIAPLNGEYAQWFFLSQDASVILAVNLNFEPVVVAWDTTTGEQHVLGEYRPCNRPQPDMARLSRDGTTLVIGCDSGLDIWRIVSGE